MTNPIITTDKDVSANAATLKRIDVMWGPDETGAFDAPLSGHGSVHFTGTWGGAVAKLQASNNGETWVDMYDQQGVAISAADDAMFEFDTSARYLRPLVSGGTGASVSTYLSMWSAKQ